MDYCNERLIVAEGEIKFVEDKLAAVERRLLEPGADTPYLRDERKQLREEKRLILEKERLILEINLRQSPGR